jgi:hypothetical protein
MKSISKIRFKPIVGLLFCISVVGFSQNIRYNEFDDSVGTYSQFVGDGNKDWLGNEIEPKLEFHDNGDVFISPLPYMYHLCFSAMECDCASNITIRFSDNTECVIKNWFWHNSFKYISGNVGKLQMYNKKINKKLLESLSKGKTSIVLRRDNTWFRYDFIKR